MNKPCEYCGCDLPLGVDKKTRQQRSHHFATCKARPAPEVKPFAQRTWVGLSDEEAVQTWEGVIKYAPSDVRIKDFARAIEAKLKEKNT
jgi:hypothetical protein